MFDTVHFQDYRIIRKDFEGDWDITHTKKKNEDSQETPGAYARHKHLNLRAYSHDGTYFSGFQVPSLPRLLYGHNGVVIHSQKDLDVAVKVADLLFDQICSPIYPSGDYRKYSRADVAIQIQMNYKELEIAYATAKQFRSQKTAEIHPGESIMLPRSGQNLKFYNKKAQIESKRKDRKKLKFKPRLPYYKWLEGIPRVVESLQLLGYQDPPNDVVRIEVQFQKSKINKFLGNDEERPNHLDLLSGYQALREVLCDIRVERFPGVSKRIATFLALVNYHDPKLFEIYLNKCVGEYRAKKLRREVGRLMPSLVSESIVWENLLPENYFSSQQITMPGPRPIDFNPNDPEAIHKTKAPLYHPPYPDLVKKAREASRDQEKQLGGVSPQQR